MNNALVALHIRGFHILFHLLGTGHNGTGGIVSMASRQEQQECQHYIGLWETHGRRLVFSLFYGTFKMRHGLLDSAIEEGAGGIVMTASAVMVTGKEIDIHLAFGPERDADAVFAVSLISSFMVFHSPQDGHFPYHLGLS